MSWKERLCTPYFLYAVYTLTAVLSSVQRWAMGFDSNGVSKYENYRIFKYSWHHFISGENPYTGHPETWDLYKYSPAFSVAMAPFTVMPDWMGLILWNICNALPLLAAVLAIPGLSVRKRAFMAWLILPELVISVQNAQSNGLVAAMMLWTYIALDRNRSWQAAGWIMGSAFIKVFGIFAAFFAAFYYKQWKWLVVALTGWAVLLAFGPALLIGWSSLMQLYRWWWELLTNDHSVSTGLSVAGWLKTWWGYEGGTTIITVFGLGIQLIAVAIQAWRKQSALPIVASILIWVVIFNHKAESPTFIIAMCGAALWYYSLTKATVLETGLLILAFFFASVAPTDIFPAVWYRQWVQPYTLKAVPFILIWTWLMISILRNEQRIDLEIS